MRYSCKFYIKQILKDSFLSLIYIACIITSLALIIALIKILMQLLTEG